MLLLRRIATDAIPLEAECVAPDRLAALALADIAALPVLHGNARATLGDFFAISGDPADAEVRVEGDCRSVKWLGARMAGGRLDIRGPAGMHVGGGMIGGHLIVHGDADIWAGAEMRGGSLRVRGSAGDHAGAAYPGSRAGMRGGSLLIDGDAGDEVGAAMRRGLIAVGGRCGAFAGAAVVAGSLYLFGAVGPYVGAGLKRGTIVTFAAAPTLLPTFRYDCRYRPAFVELYLRRLRADGFAVPASAFCGEFRKYRGDLVTVGKGEILISV